MEIDEKQKNATEAAGYIAGAGFGMARSMLREKAISASIVVLAAAVLLTGGSYIQHSDTKLLVQSVGCVVGLLGLVGWMVSVREK